MGVNVHRGTDIGVSEKFLHILRCGSIGQKIARESVPIGYNKDKSGSSLFARVSGFVLILFPLKNGPKMGSTGGGEKPGLHLKDKFS